MPIKGVQQPDYIEVDEMIRLRKFDGHYEFAHKWYQDPEIVWLVDGDKKLYTDELMDKMYHYLNETGELYFIEVLSNGVYQPIGDVTFSREDMPIVIGDKHYWEKGIGTKVVKKLIERARTLGYKEIKVEEIYSWNEASQKLFTKLGFQPNRKTAKGMSYKLVL